MRRHAKRRHTSGHRHDEATAHGHHSNRDGRWNANHNQRRRHTSSGDNDGDNHVVDDNRNHDIPIDNDPLAHST